MQMNLFDYIDVVQQDDSLQRNSEGTLLNGCYYELSSGLYVSYVLGRRHWQGDGKNEPAEWRNRIKKERSI